MAGVPQKTTVAFCDHYQEHSQQTKDSHHLTTGMCTELSSGQVFLLKSFTVDKQAASQLTCSPNHLIALPFKKSTKLFVEQSNVGHESEQTIFRILYPLNKPLMEEIVDKTTSDNVLSKRTIYLLFRLILKAYSKQFNCKDQHGCLTIENFVFEGERVVIHSLPLALHKLHQSMLSKCSVPSEHVYLSDQESLARIFYTLCTGYIYQPGDERLLLEEEERHIVNLIRVGSNLSELRNIIKIDLNPDDQHLEIVLKRLKRLATWLRRRRALKSFLLERSAKQNDYFTILTSFDRCYVYCVESNKIQELALKAYDAQKEHDHTEEITAQDVSLLMLVLQKEASAQDHQAIKSDRKLNELHLNGGEPESNAKFTGHLMSLLEAVSLILEFQTKTNCKKKTKHRPGSASSCYCLKDSKKQQIEHHTLDQSLQQSTEQFDTIKLVRIERADTSTRLGLTVQVDAHRVYVARILYKSLVERSKCLQIGDEILEVNGTHVRSKSVQEIHALFSRASGSLQLLIKRRRRHRPEDEDDHVHERCVYLKCLHNFDLDQSEDTNDDIYLQLNRGEIIRVVETKRSTTFWQAVKIDGNSGFEMDISGLIPSPLYLEQVMVAKNTSNGSQATGHITSQSESSGTRSLSLCRKSKNHHNQQSAIQVAQQSPFQSDFTFYEEVVPLRWPAFKYKCLVLIGAHGVGRRAIKKNICVRYPDKFDCVSPYTTNPSTAINYTHLSEKQFLNSLNEFLEYGEHEGHLYGLPFAEIEQIVASNKMPVLDIEPSSLLKLRGLRTLTPLLTIFVRPPEAADCGPLTKLQNDSRQLERQFIPFVDEFVTNDGDIELLAHIVYELADNPDDARIRWLPLTWVYD